MARGLRAEEPALEVLCVAVGNTASSFADAWDPEVAGRAFEAWVADGLLRYEVLQCQEMADAIVAAVLDPDSPDELLIAGAICRGDRRRVAPGVSAARRVCARAHQRGEGLPVDLLHGGAGQLVGEDDRLGQLVGGQALPGVPAQASSVGASAPGRGTTTATPISPMTGSGRGTTATWATPGWSARTFSTSRG